MQKRFSDYLFKIYEYVEAKPIVSIKIQEEYEEISKYNVQRENPDKITITYSFSGNEEISFKESFHKSWKAKDDMGREIEIYKTDEGFMKLTPYENSKQVTIFQTKTLIQKIGIFFSIIGLILTGLIFFNRTKKK